MRLPVSTKVALAGLSSKTMRELVSMISMGIAIIVSIEGIDGIDERGLINVGRGS